MQPATERRRSPRAKASAVAHLTLADGITKARLRDISSSGVRCLTDRNVPVMTQVRLVITLEVPGSDPIEIACEGAVVRSAPLPAREGDRSFDTAIFFTAMGEGTRERIEDFVELSNV
jgi:hypothetical protein